MSARCWSINAGTCRHGAFPLVAQGDDVADLGEGEAVD
jgi:hypothetical protein